MMKGSSPLTRGKPLAPAEAAVARGLIPAHAGKTCRRPMTKKCTRAHPRSRGENRIKYIISRDGSGSSPLTRGKHDVLMGSMDARGLIPAHAGKTSREGEKIEASAAHPRSRGENGVGRRPPVGSRGSSPLTRGKLRRRHRCQLHRGLIPAHAGKTAFSMGPRPPLAAHPRSRGENKSEAGRACLLVGSSPLTRGKLDEAFQFGKIGGLIPAHAGKTKRLSSSRRPCRAHPRSRGENAIAIFGTFRNGGSSPLTRGKHNPAPRRRASAGLIPAHAGKTPAPHPRICPGRAHPRSRGENPSNGGPKLAKTGSSPLTRGKPLVDRGQKLREGLIPAHAGKTGG